MGRITAVAALLALACQPATSAAPAFTDADRQAIEAQRTVWVTAANANDADALAAVYTEDATLMPPHGRAVTGRLGAKEVFTAVPIGDVKLTATDVIGGGADLAVVRGAYSLNAMPPGAPAAVADTGKFVEVWRKQADGKWLLSWDIWNSDLPLPTALAK